MNTLLAIKYLNASWKDVSWKVILVIFLVVIIFFVLIGLIGKLIEIIMTKQGKAVDHDMANLVMSKVIDNKKDFKKIAMYKSRVRFLKASIYPLILLFIAFLTWIIYACSIKNFSQSIFNRETGIMSLFYELDFSSIEYYPPFGIAWNKLVWIKPTPFSDIRITNYFIFFFLITGLIWYLVVTQAYVARFFRINKLSKTIYSVNLDNVDLQTFYSNKIKNVEENTTSTPQNN